MKYIILPLFLFLISCQTKTKERTEPIEPEVMLLGSVGVNDFKLEPYNSWYDSIYNAYTTEIDSVEQITELMSDVELEVYFGTWCSDSRREIPAFHKIMDELGMDKTSLKHVAVDRDKVEPENQQEGKNIEFVPTFIFYKNGLELGRIIESPVTSLEEDLKSILLNKKEEKI